MAERKSTVARAILFAILAFFCSFIIFNIGYIRWAVYRYPHHNSMAGVSAFYSGLPVAGLVAIFTFVVVLLVTQKQKHDNH
jgi:uncharacterized membrane protein